MKTDISDRLFAKMVVALAGAAVLGTVGAAEPWRFGLRQAKINAKCDWSTAPTFTEITAAGPAMAHVKATENDYSTQTYTDPVTGKKSNWNKQNTTFVYEGKIHLIGGKTYVFAKYLDDAAVLSVNRTKLFDNSEWKGFPTGTFSPAATGWYDFACRVGDGTGGKGPTVTDGKWPATMGLGYNTCGLKTHGEPTTDPNVGWVKLANDPETAPGALFRVQEESDFFTVDRVAVTEGGFTVTVTAAQPGVAVVYCGTTMGVVEDEDTWASASAAVEFTEDDLQKDVFFAWTEETKPYFSVKFTGQDDESAFLQWADGFSLTPTPQVAAAVSQVQPTQVDISQTISYVLPIEGETLPDISVVAYYDVGDRGAESAHWAHSKDVGVCELGTSTLTIDGLEPGADYCARLCLTAGSVTVWSDPIPFSTGGAFLRAPESIYENDTKTQKFTVSRPATSTAEELVVYLTYSENATTLAEGLPASVTIPAGSAAEEVEFTTIDNATKDGDATLVITIAEDPNYVRGNPYTASVTIVDDESLEAGVCTWTGAAGDKLWRTAGNWDLGRVPRITDTARFTSEGIAANDTVIVDTEAIIKELKIETATSFTLGAAETGGTLELGALTRADVEGSEGNHTLSVPTHLYAGSKTNCVWDVAGSGALVIRCDFTKTAGTCVYKTGAGTVEMRYKNTTFAGPWIINEGTILCPEENGNTFKGATTIGGGENAAKLQQAHKNSIAGKTPVTIYRNGIFQSGDIDHARVETINVHEGGEARIGSYFYTLYANLWGGTYNGGDAYNAKDIRVHASDTLATMNVYWRFEGYYNYGVYVDRGTAPVDLLFARGLAESASNKTVSKYNAGIVKSTANFNNLKSHFRIEGGAWYVDNPGEYGLGLQETTVAAGATLGGTGCVGMKDAKNISTVSVENGSATKYGSVVAGTIDAETGEHIFGTLTLARATAHNPVTFGSYTHVVAGLGAAVRDEETGKSVSPNDKLLVYGKLTLGENCVLDLASNSTAELDAIKNGTYTVVAADEIVGSFAEIIKPEGAKWHVRYVTDSAADEGAEPVVTRIEVTINRGFQVIVR